MRSAGRKAKHDEDAIYVQAVESLRKSRRRGFGISFNRIADRTQRYRPMTIGGYVLQMTVIPMLALAGSWPIAALLIVLEIVGKATRNPPRDAMPSHAAKETGFGWGSGIHEALDQSGAMLGLLAVALVLAITHGQHKIACAALGVPALMTFSLVAVARVGFPQPHFLGAVSAPVTGEGLPRSFGSAWRALPWWSRYC